MSDIPPVGGPPPPIGPNPADTPPPYPGGGGGSPQYFKGGSWSSFEKWLGPKNYAEFRDNLCREITQQIAKDKKQQQKAARQLKKSETGKDMYD